MKFKWLAMVVLAGFFALAAPAQPTNVPPKLPELPDKHDISYALGMRLALEIKRAGTEVDPDVVAKAMKDVLAGRRTEIPESEIRFIFMQIQAATAVSLSKKNQREAQMFLTKNAQAPGVVALPDGLQYRVLTEGTGPTPQTNDAVLVNYQDELVDGTKIDHKEHYRMPIPATVRGLRQAIPMMKVGSKWRIFVPSSLAYGHLGMRQIGPDSMLIFEVELLGIEPPSSPSRPQPGVSH